MVAIGISNILAVNVIPTTFMKKTYSLIIFMTDYYSKELQKIVSFPSEYYLPVLTFIENGFEEENKKGKAKFKLINSIGMKSVVATNVGLSRYSAIVSHGSKKYPGCIFPSLAELIENGMSTEHFNESELNNIAKSGVSKGIDIEACNAGYWANGNLSASSKASTEISILLANAVKKLLEKSKTE